MTDENRESETTDGLNRRRMLKGTAVAGLAGSGLAGTASADGWKELTLCSAGPETFGYFVRVSGELRRGGTYESDSGDEVGADYAEGACADQRCDSFLFTGEIERLNLDGPGKVFVDGNLVRDTTKLPNKITVQSKGQKVNYKFRVSGRVTPGPNAGGTENIQANTVRGSVGSKTNGTDSVDDFRYSGSLAFDRADGPLRVTLDLNDH